MHIELDNINFWESTSSIYNKRWHISPQIKDFSYTLESGKAYHIVSGYDHYDNYDYNSQGLCWLIGGIIAPMRGRITRDGVSYPQTQRRQDFWMVRYDEIKRFGRFSQSVKKQIRHGINHYPDRFTEQDYIREFKLSSGRYDRLLRQFSTEGYKASCAVGHANQKMIFCFPVLEERFVTEYEDRWLKPMIDFLKDSGKIVLMQLPAHVNTVGICDERVYVGQRTTILLRHIERRPNDEAHYLIGKDITVEFLVQFINNPEWSVKRISATHDLTPAEIHSAWAFYYEHQGEIDTQIAKTPT